MGGLEPGTTFGSYELGEQLGRGGMGVVHRARDTRLGRQVALKLLAPEQAGDWRFRERFLRESRAAASIDHPGVLPIYEAEEAGGRLFIAMRLVEGEDLGALLRREGAMEPDRAVDLVAQVADALDAVHRHGLVHRDVKPANVLLDRTGAREHAYLTDFGITKVPEEHTPLTDAGAFLGTVDYCAPEVIRGDELDPRCDVYSLGCVLFECLTGERPFARASHLAAIYAHLEDTPPSVREHRPGLPTELAHVVQRALAKDPAERFQTAGELATAARSAMGRAAPSRPAETPRTAASSPSPASHTGRPRWALPAAGAAAALAVVVAVALTQGDGGGDDDPGAAATAASTTTAAATPAAGSRACPTEGVVARGAGSVVVRDGERVVGCRNGVQTVLGDTKGGARLRLLRFRGDHLALVRVAGGVSEVQVFDLRAGRRTYASTKTADEDPSLTWAVTDLVVATDGRAAWMAKPREATDLTTVWIRKGQDAVPINTGRLRPGSLFLSADEAGIEYGSLDGARLDSGF